MGRRGSRPSSIACRSLTRWATQSGEAWRARAFDVFSREPDEFTAALHVRPFLIGSREYHAKVELKGAGEWETVELRAEQFIATSGASPLSSWSSVEMLELRRPEDGWGDEGIVFTHFRWVD